MYQSAGFTSVSIKFLVSTGISTVEIIGIIIGSLASVLLIVGLVIGLIMRCVTNS